MKVKALLDFSSTTHGYVKAGQIIDVGTAIGFQMRDAGMIEFLPEKKPETMATPKPSPSLPEGQALRETKPENSQPLETKNESESLPSTRPTRRRTATTSTQPIDDGGSTTPKRRGRKPKDSDATPTQSSSSD